MKKHAYKNFILTLSAVISIMLMIGACRRYEPIAMDPEFDMDMVQESSIEVSLEEGTEEETTEEETTEEETEPPEEPDLRVPTKVKGIYLASKPLNNQEFMSTLWDNLDNTELNAVVIDIKDDYGKVTYDMQNVPELVELKSIEVSIPDMIPIMQKFKEHGIYTIARIVSMRDPHLGYVKPEWCLQLPDGTVFRDNSNYAWINPYKTEYWDYLLNIGRECAHIGFDEIQFDYIRFCTERGSSECVFDEEDVKGRDKISIITECVTYLSENLKKEGVFDSSDVFGTIIRSQIDSRSVGQSYSQMASVLDYICPMVYPSHYASGSFGLDAPDAHPYESILGALARSRSELSRAQAESAGRQAIVRPWLQSFTATWLGGGRYIAYDANAVRQEIQGVYDSGYDEWILWSASVKYFYEGFLTPSQAEAEEIYIAESRAALPPEDDPANEEETFPPELAEALDGDELYAEDEEILLQDGPIITSSD
ncbi:MAG: putative glycoside hydrolase [Lachnospiraceae bacterium]|nr:putative glycoside hydrolase [Lachnospiraceae bacterium]